MVTGSGKTEVLAGLIKALPCTTVILAEQRIIIEQIKERLELRDVVSDVGLFYAGETPTGQLVIVGSVQSVALPTKIPKPPNRSEHETDASFDKATKKFAATMQGFRSRQK